MIPSLSPIVTHLWQSTLFTAMAGLLALALSKNRAAVRYRLWLAASAKFLLPFSWLTALGSRVEWQTAPAMRSAALPRAVEQLFLPAVFQPSWRAAAATSSSHIAAWLATAWAIGVATVLLSWWRQWQPLRAAVARARPLTLDVEPSLASMRVMSSADLLEPGIVGIRRPVLLLPAGITDRLSPAQLRAILIHERCHLRRRDNLAALMHMLVEALFWFHPGVWWLETRLVLERERACDEDVLRSGADAAAYAEGILNVCRFFVESPLVCASGVTGSDLKRRIEAIMANRATSSLSGPKRALLGLAAIVAVSGPLVAGAFRPSLTPSTSAAPQAAASSNVPRIEVASIKKDTSGGPGPIFGAQSGGFAVHGISPALMMEIAYNVQSFQVSGAPAWTSSERYDIIVKLEGAANNEIAEGHVPQILQALLADRFQLRVHRAKTEQSMYALMTVNGRPKVQRAAGTRPYQISPQAGYISGTMELGLLARWLEWRLEQPVVDKTRLTGEYDIELVWTPDVGQRAGGLPPPAPPPPPPPPPAPPGGGQPITLPARTPPSPDPNGPSLFTAIQEQLGLKLDAQKGAVDTIVVDRIERPSPD